MDPNRFVERMLHHIQTASDLANAGDYVGAIQEWQEVTDNLSDLKDWLAKGGFPPSLIFEVILK